MTARWVVVAAAGVTLAAALALAWVASRRLPVAATRAFLTAPIEVGERPPPPAEPADAAAVARRYAAARAAFAAGDYAEAAAGFAFVVERDPQGPDAGAAQWNLTRSRLRSGDATGALAALHDLLGQHGAFLREQAPGLRDGLDRMQRGDLPGAEAAFERMVGDQPGSEFVPLAYAMIARIHWTHGDATGMVRAFARMLASVPDAVPAYARLAHALDRYADGDRDMPNVFADMARTAGDGFGDIYQYLAARSSLEQGRFEAARDALETLRVRYPDGDFTHIVDLEHAWNLLRHGDAAEALAVFERLAATPAPARDAGFDEFFDLRAELPMGIARCQLVLGRYTDAAASFERALAGGGIYAAENRIGLAAAYEGAGQLDRAAAELRRVVREGADEPSRWAVQQQLARVESRLAATER